MEYGELKSQTVKFNLLLPICCFILIFSAVSYWASISNNVWQQQQRQILNQQTVTYAIEIENKIKHILSSHQLIKHKITAEQGEMSNIEALVDNLLAHHQEIVRISFAPNLLTTAVFPRTYEQTLVGRLVSPPRSKNNQTRVSARTFYSVPVVADNQQMLFTVNKPLEIRGQFWGFVSYQLNITQIVSQLRLVQLSSDGYRFQLSHISAHNKFIVLASSEQRLGHVIYNAPVRVPEDNWLLEMSYDNDNFIAKFNIGWIFTLLLTSFITLIIYWALLEPRRVRRQLLRATTALDSRNHVFNTVLDNMSEGIIVCNDDGEIYLSNHAAKQLYGSEDNQYLTEDDQTENPANDTVANLINGLLHKALYRGEELELETVITPPSRLPITLKSQSKLMYQDNKQLTGAMILIEDITQLKQATNSHTSRNVILDMLAHEKPINSIFEHIINDIESKFGDIAGAVLLTDHNNRRFVEVIAPKLADNFHQALTELEIGERVISCGSAAYLNKMVIVEDVTTHPYWIDFKNISWNNNIRSAWSNPIHSASGELLGCFDIYSKIVNPASPALVLALKEAATLTALAIERHRDSQRLRKISLAVQHSPNALLIIDRCLNIDYVNPKFCLLTGYQAAELVGKPYNKLTSSKDNTALQEEIWQCVTQGKDWRGEIKSIKKNGDAYWAYDHISPIKNAQGTITKFVIVQEDITENRHQASQFDYQLNHDMLTGLINTHGFNKNVLLAVDSAKLEHNQHAICVVDLDNFNQINRQCGQTAGDEFLRQIAAIFRNHLRQRDTLARLNADQFAILMKDCSLESARRCCDELLTLLADHKFMWQSNQLSITGRIGITWIDQNSESYEQLMVQADLACFQAKIGGGNQTILYQRVDQPNVNLFGDAYWANKIRTALENNNFILYVQTTSHLLTTAGTAGIEILVRLKEGDKLILPKQFLPAAIRYNLASRLDLWVIEHTLHWLNDHSKQLQPINSISINLSSASFGDDSQLIKIISIIEQHKGLAKYLVFEITEYIALSSLSKAYNFIESLHQYGVNFALDNFGNGNLSFAQMRDIPICRVNIDGHLINSIIDNKVARVQVQSIAAMARVMNIATTAKHVENPELIPLLKELSIDVIQGFYHSKPQPINSLLTNQQLIVDAQDQ